MTLSNFISKFKSPLIFLGIALVLVVIYFFTLTPVVSPEAKTDLDITTTGSVCSFFDGKTLGFGKYTIEDGLIFYHYQVSQAVYNVSVDKKRIVTAEGHNVNLNSYRDQKGNCLTDKDIIEISDNIIRLSNLSGTADTYILAGYLYPVDITYNFKPLEITKDNTKDSIGFRVSDIGVYQINIETGNVDDWYIFNPDQVFSPNLQLKNGTLYFKDRTVGRFIVLAENITNINSPVITKIISEWKDK